MIQPATLIQTSDDQSVSKLGQPISPASPSSGSITSGMTVTSQITVGPIKPTDRKTLEGSYSGDFRTSGDSVKLSMDKIANPPGPRDGACQAPLSGKQTPASAPVATLDDSEIGG